MLFQVLFFFPLLLFIKVHADDELAKTAILANIKEEIEVGKTLEIEVIATNPSKTIFVITLQKGDEETTMYHFHGDLCIGISKLSTEESLEIYTANNNKIENLTSYDDFPTVDETGKYEIKIEITEDKYKISINDKSYEHPITLPLKSLTHSRIAGTVKVKSFEWFAEGEKDCPS